MPEGPQDPPVDALDWDALSALTRRFASLSKTPHQEDLDATPTCPTCEAPMVVSLVGRHLLWVCNDFAYCQQSARPDAEGQPRHIPNSALRPELIPPPGPSLMDDRLGAFMFSFRGYDYWGGAEPTYAIADEVIPRHDSVVPRAWPLTAVRTALFVWQRRLHHHYPEPPENGSAEHAQILSLLEAIREKVLAGDVRW
jgi:hypothetical protein